METLHIKTTISRIKKDHFIHEIGVSYTVNKRTDSLNLLDYIINIHLIYEARFEVGKAKIWDNIQDFSFEKRSIGLYSMHINHLDKTVTYASEKDFVFDREHFINFGIGTFAFNELVKITKTLSDEYTIKNISLSFVDADVTKLDGNNHIRRDSFYKNFGFEIIADDKGNGYASIPTISALQQYRNLKTIEAHSTLLLEQLKNTYAENQKKTIKNQDITIEKVTDLHKEIKKRAISAKYIIILMITIYFLGVITSDSIMKLYNQSINKLCSGSPKISIFNVN